MQRNFEPMRKQVEAWQRSELTNVTAKVAIYEAFVEERLKAPSISLELSMTVLRTEVRGSTRGRSGFCRMRSPPAFKELDSH
jgi:hypothetical protein